MTNLLELIARQDAALFILLNQRLANPVCDFIMPVVTNDWLLRGVFVIMVLCFFIWGKRHGRIVALMCIVSLALSDQASSHLVKPLVNRVRPCHVISTVHLLVNCSQGLSFPSSHAANSFSQALILSLGYRQLSWLFFTLAAVISYSRIAVGVHYPLDVLAGSIVGVSCALVTVGMQRVVNWYRAAPLPTWI